MVRARSEYKNLIRSCRINYDKGQTKKLLEAKTKNAKLYWKMLKNLDHSGKTKSKPVSAQDFEKYFKAVNDPQGDFIRLMKM